MRTYMKLAIINNTNAVNNNAPAEPVCTVSRLMDRLVVRDDPTTLTHTIATPISSLTMYDDCSRDTLTTAVVGDQQVHT